MVELVAHRDRLAGAGERAIGPAEHPEIPRGVAQRMDRPIQDTALVMASVVRRQRRLAMSERGCEFPLEVLDHSELAVAAELQVGVGGLLRDLQHPGEQHACPLDLPRLVREHSEEGQRTTQPTGIPEGAADQGRQPARGEAAGILRRILEQGPRGYDEVKELCTKAGCAWRTVERAKQKLGVVTIERRDEKGKI